jgi:putative lipoic acid-binding regulatory protein
VQEIVSCFGYNSATMNNSDTPQLEFPLIFPLKIIGHNEDDFQGFVVEIVRKHFPDLLNENITSRMSNGDKYLSVSVEFWAESREKVDALCAELATHRRVKMLL